MKCEHAVMEKLSEDGFERCEQFGDWSTFSSEHWDEENGDSSGFGDWASFKEGLSEESASADLSSQEGQTSGHEHKVIFFITAICDVFGNYLYSHEYKFADIFVIYFIRVLLGLRLGFVYLLVI